MWKKWYLIKAVGYKIVYLKNTIQNFFRKIKITVDK